MQLIKSALILGALSISALAYAQDATLNVSGEVLDQTCVVKTSSRNKTVVLPTIGRNALPTASSTAGYTEFTIEFDGCNTTFTPSNTTKTKIFAFFTPTDAQLHANTGTLNNMLTSGKANNVNIQLVNADAGRTPIELQHRYNDANRFTSYEGTTMVRGRTAYEAKYGAQYYSINNNITSGKVQATTAFTVGYK